MNIKENSKILKLSYVFKNYESEIKEAKQTKKDYEIFLDELLEKEITQRKENGIKKRLRYAKFPIKKYLEDFDRKLYNPDFINEFEELETLEFIDKKENIILVRNTRCRKNSLCNRVRNQSLYGRKKCIIHICSKFNYRIKRSYEQKPINSIQKKI